MLVPDDYTRTTFIELTRQASIPIAATDPCADTTLDSFTIDDFSLTVDGPAEEQTLDEVQDSASR